MDRAADDWEEVEDHRRATRIRKVELADHILRDGDQADERERQRHGEGEREGSHMHQIGDPLQVGGEQFLCGMDVILLVSSIDHFIDKYFVKKKDIVLHRRCAM